MIPAAPLADPAADPDPAVPRRVLLVDDSRLQRKILSTSLLRWGYQVIEAGTGPAALDLCARYPVDLVISDWVMPGMSGLEFCTAFRTLPRESYGYFILLTSKSEKGEIARGLDAGADDFLTKPVNAGELRARMMAGERILRMERELRDKNRLVSRTLAEISQLYDSLNRDLVEARKLQQSLVRDRHRRFGPAEVSLLLRPSGHVGGDLVGAFPIGAGHIGLFSIDVSGHGVASALLTARIAGLLSGSAPEQNIALVAGPDGPAPRPPAEVAAHLNRLLLDEIGSDQYLTLLYADLCLASGRIAMVQAGHPHPALIRASGAVEYLGHGGLPVGLIAGARYDTFETRLAPGDRLLAMSDGLTECPDASGAELGEAGLARLLAANAGLGGPALLEALVWDLQAHSGSADFRDDISAVLLDYRPADRQHDARPESPPAPRHR